MGIAKVASSILKKAGSAASKVTKSTLLKDVAEDKITDIEKFTQRKLKIATPNADGTMQYKQLSKTGMGAVGVGMLGGKGVSTAFGVGMENPRGMVSAAENMDRFISYDGSGFVNNFNEVTGGDPEVMSDVVNHAFQSQQSLFHNDLGDIVFALHANREG